MTHGNKLRTSKSDDQKETKYKPANINHLRLTWIESQGMQIHAIPIRGS